MVTATDPTPTLESLAASRLHRVRGALADRIQAKLLEDGIGFREAGELTGLGTNMIFRLAHSEPEYAVAKLEPVAVALEWLGLTFGDLDRAQVTRKLALADIHLAITDLELHSERRELLRRVVDSSYSALREAEG